VVTDGGERGQLILIGSLLIATTIVGSIVLLNSIHESPQVYTERDTRSLEEAERTVLQVRADLQRAFLVNTSTDEVGEPLPYARDSAFDGVVEEYERQYVNLSTTDTSGIVRIERVGGRTGGIARQNQSDIGYEPYPNGAPIVQGADEIPRLSLLVNDTSVTPFTVRIAESMGPDSVSLDISDSGVQKTGGTPWTCDLSGDDGPIEIDFTKGVGEVRTPETYCGDLAFGTSLSPELDVRIIDGDEGDGTYTITAVDPSAVYDPPESYRWGKDSGGYLVDPEFEIEYWDPNVAYNATFTLYG